MLKNDIEKNPSALRNNPQNPRSCSSLASSGPAVPHFFGTGWTSKGMLHRPHGNSKSTTAANLGFGYFQMHLRAVRENTRTTDGQDIQLGWLFVVCGSWLLLVGCERFLIAVGCCCQFVVVCWVLAVSCWMFWWFQLLPGPELWVGRGTQIRFNALSDRVAWISLRAIPFKCPKMIENCRKIVQNLFQPPLKPARVLRLRNQQGFQTPVKPVWN